MRDNKITYHCFVLFNGHTTTLVETAINTFKVLDLSDEKPRWVSVTPKVAKQLAEVGI